jgi:hypothetical protein
VRRPLAEPVSASFRIHAKPVLFEGLRSQSFPLSFSPGPGRLKKREKWKHEKRKKDAKTEAAFL